LITRHEKESVRILDNQFIERLCRLSDGEKILGMELMDGTKVFRSGKVITSDDIKTKIQEGILKPDIIKSSLDYFSDEKMNDIFQEMTYNYQRKRYNLIGDFKAEKNKVISGDELQPGILQMSKVYIAKKRKLQIGDKMAGRHGNKGIVSKIVPVEDMPFMPDGTTVDIVLNPLVVPSRMNLGQLYETGRDFIWDHTSQLLFLMVLPGMKFRKI